MKRKMKPSQVYLLNEISKTPGAKVLDFACSRGWIWDHIPEHTLIYGCDVALTPEMAERIRGREERFRLSVNPEKIPYPDEMFDIVFSNSAFEHVRPIESIIAECARVLKPGGRLIAVFPCKTVIIEPHVHVPFATWMPGILLRLWGHLWTGRGEWVNRVVREKCNYLRYGRYRAMLSRHFTLRDITAELTRLAGRRPLPSWAVTRFYAAAIDAVKR